MSGIITSSIVAGSSLLSVREGHIARKDAKTELKRSKKKEAEDKAERDALLTEEKRKQNELLKSRMRRSGSAGTIFAGAFKNKQAAPVSLLGDI